MKKTSKIKKEMEHQADKATRWIGSTRSIIVHSALFLIAFLLLDGLVEPEGFKQSSSPTLDGPRYGSSVMGHRFKARYAGREDFFRRDLDTVLGRQVAFGLQKLFVLG